MAKVFISYSHGDEDIRIKLVEHLTNLKRQGVISIWDDRFLLAGEEFTTEIMRQMMSSDIIVLLISSKFIRSDYCMDKELPLALEMHSKGEAVVAPIILNDCAWDDIGISKLIALPKDRKPIKRHGNRDEAYTYITDQIKTRAQLISSRPEYINKYLNQSDKTLSLIKNLIIWLLKAIVTFSLGTIKEVIALFSNKKSTRGKRSKKKDSPALTIIIAISIVAILLFNSPSPEAENIEYVAYEPEELGYSAAEILEAEGVSRGFFKTSETLDFPQQIWCTDNKNLEKFHARLNCGSGFIWNSP